MIKQGGCDKWGGGGKKFHCSAVNMEFLNNFASVGKPASIYTLNVN